MQLFVKDKEFYNQIKTLAIPVVIQGLITAGVNMMDTFMVGQLGKIQLSAASLANQFIMIFQIMCFGLGFGAAVLTAQFYGSNNNQALKKIVTIMLRITLLFAVLFSWVTFFYPNSLMSFYTPDKAIIVKGALFFKISAFAFIFMAFSTTITAILRSVGEVRIPLRASMIAFVVNVFLNWVFIFGKLGAPRMEIEGAAIGTLIARIVEATIIVGYFLVYDKKINYKLKDLFIRTKEYVLLYISFCIPVFISDTLLAFGNNMVSIIMGHIGASFVSAYAIISQLSRMTTIFTQGVSNASAIITGNTLGSGDRKKAYDQGITFAVLSVIIGVLAALVFLAICPLVIRMFNVDSETVSIAYEMMFSMLIIIVFQSVQSVLTKGILRGGGDTKFLMLADVIFLWMASIPLGYFTGLVWGLPAFWVMIALKADWIIKSFWCLKRLKSGKWIKQVEVRHE